MLICYQFHLGNLHTLMEKTTLSGVIKCIVIYFPSILVSRRLLKTE
jgi:DNA integrity scanning protein DisA with diadenylate cyclase activity